MLTAGGVMAAKPTTGRDVTAALREAVDRLAERARSRSWTYEKLLAARLPRPASACGSHSGEGHIRSARFPYRKCMEECNFDYNSGFKRDIIAHPGTLGTLCRQ